MNKITSTTVDEIMKRLEVDMVSGDLFRILASPAMCRYLGWTKRRERRARKIEQVQGAGGMWLIVLLERREDNVHMLALDDAGQAYIEVMQEELEVRGIEHLMA